MPNRLTLRLAYSVNGNVNIKKPLPPSSRSRKSQLLAQKLEQLRLTRPHAASLIEEAIDSMLEEDAKRHDDARRLGNGD